jgi:hypothetical protein
MENLRTIYHYSTKDYVQDNSLGSTARSNSNHMDCNPKSYQTIDPANNFSKNLNRNYNRISQDNRLGNIARRTTHRKD